MKKKLGILTLTTLAAVLAMWSYKAIAQSCGVCNPYDYYQEIDTTCFPDENAPSGMACTAYIWSATGGSCGSGSGTDCAVTQAAIVESYDTYDCPEGICDGVLIGTGVLKDPDGYIPACTGDVDNNCN